MKKHMKKAMDDNLFNCDVAKYGTIFAQLELQGYTHKEIKKLVNSQLKYVGITSYKFTRHTINQFICEHEVVAHIKGLSTAMVTDEI